MGLRLKASHCTTSTGRGYPVQIPEVGAGPPTRSNLARSPLDALERLDSGSQNGRVRLVVDVLIDAIEGKRNRIQIVTSQILTQCGRVQLTSTDPQATYKLLGLTVDVVRDRDGCLHTGRITASLAAGWADQTGQWAT